METINTNTSEIAITQSNDDFKHAVLIVSVAVNAFVLTAWLLAQFSAEYASQLVSLI